MSIQFGPRARRLVFMTVSLVAVASSTAAVVLAGGATFENGREVTAVRTVWSGTSVGPTTSHVESDVPGMSLTVKVPAGQQALLLITFSASSTCTDSVGSNNGCLILARVDNVLEAPGAFAFDQASDGPGLEGHSAQFVATVGSGTHTVKIGWYVSDPDGSGSFQLTDPVLSVLRSRIP